MEEVFRDIINRKIKVISSKRATPLVPVVELKGKIRICGDFKVMAINFLKINIYIYISTS